MSGPLDLFSTSATSRHAPWHHESSDLSFAERSTSGFACRLLLLGLRLELHKELQLLGDPLTLGHFLRRALIHFLRMDLVELVRLVVEHVRHGWLGAAAAAAEAGQNNPTCG